MLFELPSALVRRLFPVFLVSLGLLNLKVGRKTRAHGRLDSVLCKRITGWEKTG